MSVSTGREVTFLRFESVSDRDPTLADFSVLFDVLAAEWGEACEHEMARQLNIPWGRLSRSQKDELPKLPLSPARMRYGSPLDLLIDHHTLLAGITLGPMILNRWLDGVARIAGFQDEVREFRVKRATGKAEATYELIRAQRRLEAQEQDNQLRDRLERATATPELEPAEAKRRSQIEKTGLAVTYIAQVPEDEVPQYGG